MRCASAGARPRPGPACMRQMRRRLKNHARETAQFRARALLGFVIVVLALGGLAGWYFKLQVLDHADYAKRSEANRIKPRPVVPARGIIYDRKGRILADNVPAFRLDVVPEDAGDPKALVRSEEQTAELQSLMRISYAVFCLKKKKP